MRLSFLIAFLIAAAVSAWIFSGQISGSPVTTPEPEVAAAAGGLNTLTVTPNAPLMTVRTVEQTAVARQREISFRGQTEISRSVMARSEVGGTVEEILVAKGDRVTAGQILARLDLVDRIARLAEIQALVKQRETEYSIARSLTEQGHRPMTALVASETALESASAALQLIELEIERTVITAPFAGVVEDRPIQYGDVIGPGSPVALIVDEDPFLIAGNVAETDISSVKVGGTGTARFLDGTTIEGTVRFVATVADPQTRTFRVEVEVDNPNRNLRAGLTTDLTLPVGETLAHFVSPAALILDEGGALGVKAVDQNNIVQFLPARVIAADGNGVWLDGLPQTVAIITVGHQFVRAGDPVNAVPDTDAGL